MHISEITINRFCSIEYAHFRPSAFNIFVGQNNHGKTNVFEALNWFFTNKGDVNRLRHGRTGTDEVSVELEFQGVQAALSAMKNERNRASIQKLIGDRDDLRAKRTSLDPKIRKVFDPTKDEWLDKNPTGFDTAFNDFMPVFEYVDTSTPLSDVAKYSKSSPIGAMLSGVLTTLLERSEPYREFRQKFDALFSSPESDVRLELDKVGDQVTIYISRQFPDCTSVKFRILEPAFEDLLKGFNTEIDDGIVTDASEKGDGMQRALMLAILQSFADFRKQAEAKGKQFLFLIDEAELHLHPTAQRNLKIALNMISGQGDQVFMNTHSSVLVADELPNQSIFSVEKNDKKTSVYPVAQSRKPFIIYELLGGSPSDLLLPRNFLIVEGRSDQIFISSIIERFYQDRPPLQIIFSEGDFERQRQSMTAINTLYAPLSQNPIYRDRLVILCDRPHPTRQADFDEFLRIYPRLRENHQIHVLPVTSLEEYYVGQFRKTPTEVEELGRTLRLKRDLAKNVGVAISKEDFESGMPVIHEALEKCWTKAFS